jgi:tRNA modification GTPase
MIPASSSDTIFAVASGFGRAAVSIVRLSGSRSRTVLEELAGALPDPRRLTLRVLREPGSGLPLDQALVVWFPGPRTFTGEDQAELHIHGGLATRAAVLRTLGAFEGCRPAEAGEFTRRAFLNGRMDLAQVEGLADIIDAETEAQRRQAMRQLEGELGHAVEAWREQLLEALALLEASLDFSDEGDVPLTLERRAEEILQEVERSLARVLANRSGERLRDGFMVVLAGRPNSGKSTLLNALARRDVAIVSPVPGTTRDVIEVRCDLKGLPVTFVDTAGLRESDDLVEKEGIRRALARASAADLVLWLLEPGDTADEPPGPGVQTIRVGTKSDLAHRSDCDIRVSAQTGEGMSQLLEVIADKAGIGIGSGDPLLTRQRHRESLEEALRAVAGAVALLRRNGDTELAAEEARLATRAIGRITGRVDVEDVLDKLFATFCIGK